MNNFEIENLSTALTEGQIPENIDIENIDITELFDSEILDSIPGLRELKSLYKGYISIRDRLFTKKFALFLKEFRSNSISEEKLQEFKNRFNSDKKFRTKIMETLISFIDEFKQLEKVKILSKLFKAYVEGHFDWKHLNNMADCLDKVNIDYLRKIPGYGTTRGKTVTRYDENKELAESNLISSGLAIKVSTWSTDIYSTQMAKDIYRYALMLNE